MDHITLLLRDVDKVLLLFIAAIITTFTSFVVVALLCKPSQLELNLLSFWLPDSIDNDNNFHAVEECIQDTTSFYNMAFIILLPY